MNVLERFWRYVDKNGPVPAHQPELGPCWIWTGSVDHRGYGAFNWKKEANIKSAHRASYKLFRIDFNPALWVLHACDRPICVNPAHLFQGTARDNANDRVAKRRQPTGEQNGVAKLSEENVKEILRRYVPRKPGRVYGDCGPLPNSIRSLAKEFGVSAAAVQFVLQKASWKYITTAH